MANRDFLKDWDKRKRNLAPECTDHELAEIALGYINDEENVKFELDVPVGSCKQVRLEPDEEWCHVSFFAKPLNADSNDSSRKLIFAELCNFMKAKFSLYVYSLMDPENPDIRDGCLFCPADGKHPHPRVEIYVAGNTAGPFWPIPSDPKLHPIPEWWRKDTGLL